MKSVTYVELVATHNENELQTITNNAYNWFINTNYNNYVTNALNKII